MNEAQPRNATFYALFRQYEGLRHLLLHHREELLEYQEIDVGGMQRTVFFPRIVLANYTNEDGPAGFLPVSTSGEQEPDSIEAVRTKWEPLRKELDAVVGQRYRKALDKLDVDLRDPMKATRLAFRVLKAINPVKREQALLDLLRDYKMIGTNVGNFSDLAEQLEGEVRKNMKKIVNEKQVSRFYETISAIRQAYQEVLLKRLYSANRLQIEARIDTEQFHDRLRWLDLLYEHGCLHGGKEEVWFSCGPCGSEVFSGYGKWDMKPSKLQNLSCPNCGEAVQYLAPYHLDDTLFEDLTSQDGLILPALEDELRTRGWPYTTNLIIPPDTELDLCFDLPDGSRIVAETKMFKLQVTERKLRSKLVEAVHDLNKVRETLQKDRPVYAERDFVLISNCSNPDLIASINRDLIRKKIPVELVAAVHASQWLDRRAAHESAS